MDIQSYRKANNLSQIQFAELLVREGHPATQSLVSQWENGLVSISPERATQIEKVTAGAISRTDLVFGPAPTQQGEAA